MHLSSSSTRAVVNEFLTQMGKGEPRQRNVEKAYVAGGSVNSCILIAFKNTPSYGGEQTVFLACSHGSLVESAERTNGEDKSGVTGSAVLRRR